MRGKEIRRRDKKRDGQSHLIVHVCAGSLVVHDLKLPSASSYSTSGVDLQKKEQKTNSNENKI
jgi:hypothetical protein